MAVTTKKTFPATTNTTTTVFSPVSIQLNNQDDLDVYVTLSGGTRVLQLRQSTGGTAQSSHPQVSNTDGLYYPAVSAGTNLYNYQLSSDNNTITFNSALPSGAVVFCERRTRDADSTYTSFASGSTIRATDLNNSARESNFTAQEARNKAFDLEGKIYNTLGQADLVVKTTDTGTVDSTMIANGAIVDADVNTSAAIAGTKISPDFGSQNIVTTGTVDGRDVSVDGTKLDTIETNAKDDQNAAEIKTLYESNANSNEFSDAEQTKLAGIETAATADQTDAEIRTAVEAATDSNVFTDADHTKLNGIETAATADQTAAEIKTLLQNSKLTLSEIDTTSTDSRYFTETELTGGALDGRYYTETEAEAKFLRQDSSETIASGVTWSNSDAFVATTAAINARIIDLIDEVGGFTAIDSEQHFPNSNPQGATGQAAILSIQAASGALAPSGTTLTIVNGNLANNANITITGVTTTIPSGFGFLVESTSTLHTYSFHRLVPPATQVNTVAQNITNIVNAGANVADINNFADIYIISSSQPTTRNDSSALQEGDLWYDSSNDNLQVYTGSAFAIITPSQSVLDDVAIVSGAITYSEDLGLITNSVTTGSSNGSLDIVADVLEDEITFTVTAATGKFIIDGVDKPALTLYKGWTYTFDVSDATNATHPLRFSSGGSAYNTNVTVTGTQGQAGAKVAIKIPESQPTSFIYYCTSHSGMGNSITVKDDPIKTVSDNVSTIIAVSNNSSNINSAVSNASNINSAVSNASNINSAVSNASNINSAVSNASNINTVAGNNTNINTVAGISSNVTTVAGISSNVTAVAGNATNINAVAADATDIGAVAGKATEIGRLGTADAVADLAILGTTDVVADLNTLATSANVTAMDNCSDDIANINTVSGSISNVNTTAGSITNVNTVATNISSVNNFADTYRIGSSNPSTSLNVGDLFFNTSASELRVYNGTQWQGGVTATGNLSQVSGSVFTGDNRYNDNVKVKFGTDSDLQIFHNTTDSIINASGVGNIKLQDQGNTKLEITSSGVSATGNIVVSGTVDGRDIATDGTKLDGIEASATADQTAGEIVGLISGQTIAPNVITTTNLTLDFGSIA